MKLIKQDGPFCVVTSAAMVLDVEPELIHDYIGHDGTRIQWPPNGMIGVHIQEIQQFAITQGYMFAPLEVMPVSAPNDIEKPVEIYGEENLARKIFENLLLGRKGILVTPGHAVAFIGHTVYDPKGFIKSIIDYEITDAWILTRLI